MNNNIKKRTKTSNIEKAKILRDFCIQIIKKEINKYASFNKKRKAVVYSINDDGTVNIKMNDVIYNNIKVRAGLSPQPNEVVWIEMPNNNFKDAYVDISRHINTKDILIKEGVFTPILVGDTTTGSNDYVVQSGYYYKIGKKVHADIRIVMQEKDQLMSGNIYIQGLPFLPQLIYKYSGNISIINNINPPEDIIMYTVHLASTMGIQILALLNSGGYISLNAENITNTTELVLSIDYLTEE